MDCCCCRSWKLATNKEGEVVGVPNWLPSSAKSLSKLRAQTAVDCGSHFADCTVSSMVAARELGTRRAPKFSQVGHSKVHTERNKSAAFSASEKVYLVNKFIPNRRERIDRAESKTFCCLYLPDGRIVTASQDEHLRFYQRYDTTNCYTMQGQYAVPYVGWSILDLALSPDSRFLAYGTWSDSVHFCRIDHIEDDLFWGTLTRPDVLPNLADR
ncbi:unnamed protein product [Gongylonema pulchrum]|uniref:WD_REPEATS_REGION domain-containing protein n=1 Tax=Gongylonema pulchrum TaxID=637853 RepID=A0A183DZM7_9BILA|nr:unnamed protein product [Gongylonema pulchrum]